MKTLAAINAEYERIMRLEGISDYQRDKKLADLMTHMERTYKIPMLRNEEWERKNRAIIALYRKISMSRTL